ncbi:ABC-type transport auxiliary lipoprotein family protein [Roseovarius sp. D22-M7]|uniref:ABC-type transport auxiliary lipoprotein family protein n=1 Tax=Roseovarius sp. D22-M7 TaxID=3127116 RepID=UPI0030100865
MIPKRRALPLLAAMMLSGCAAITAIGDATTPLQAYELRAPAEIPAVQGRLQRDLVIETPTTSGALDTDRIMIRPAPFQAAYLPQARWTDAAPVMLTTLMVRGFEDTGGLRYVGRRPLGGTADYTLISELTDFHVELGDDGETVTARFRLSAQLVRGDDMAILGSRTVQARTTVPSTDTAEVVAGLDAVTTRALRELTVWALGRMGLRVAG